MLETFTVTVIEEIKRSAEEGTLDVPIISIEFNGNKFDIMEEIVEQPTTPDNKSHVEVDRHPDSKLLFLPKQLFSNGVNFAYFELSFSSNFTSSLWN